MIDLPYPVDCFMQIVRGPVWAGDLISKAVCKRLVERGLVARTAGGYAIITKKGMAVADALGLLVLMERERRKK